MSVEISTSSPDADRGEIALIDVDEYPDGVGVGDGEALRGAGLQQLAGTDETFDNFAVDGSDDGNFGGGFDGILATASGSFRPRRGARQLKIPDRREPGLARFGLLEVSFGDGAVVEEIFRTSVEFIGEGGSVASFDVCGARDGIIGTGDEE